MKKNTLRRALMLLALLVSSHVLAAQKEMTLMLDWFVNPNHGPIIIAQERGYFKAQGLQVTIQEPADPSTPSKLVAAGKVDMAVSYQPDLTMDVAAGLPLVRSATLIATPLNALMMLDDGKPHTIADLKGKKIGISTPGSEEASIGAMLAEANLTLSDVTIINVGWALSSSLASGKVDAISGGCRNFETNQLALEGYKVQQFYPEEHGIPSYDELVFVVNSAHYDKQEIAAFNTALEQATTYIINHPQKAWQQFIAYAPDTLDTPLNKQAWQQTLTRFALRPGAVDLQRYNDYAEFLYDHKMIKTRPNAKDYVLNVGE
ncbi:ABC transporter substrate-binding protein [Vibrio zhugei]|uniref:ABC transporter substrate-binding protein n=1 Tax=Vibrio zhugei TaxID=2479546 RepID=A0ABV7CCP9_9VIBR|nr:ABC transporter substrate-binding protein [Vibrio zhugei]